MSRLLEPFSGLRASRRPVDMPVGAVVAHAGDLGQASVLNALISQGWLPCDGRTVTQASYPELYKVLGALYTPSGTASGSFCVPNYGGQFFRGITINGAGDPGYDDRAPPPGGGTKATVGSTQACMVQNHVHKYSALKGSATVAEGEGGAIPPATDQASSGPYASDGTTQLSGDETRPQNIYVNYLIKASRGRERMGVGL